MKEYTARNLRLAEQLGAETHTLVGRNVADVLLEFAHERNVTKIVVGKTAQPRWKQWFVSTIVDQLLAKSGDIDIYIVSGEGETPSAIRYPAGNVSVRWREYLLAAAVVAVCGLIAWAAHVAGLADANIVMIFLAGVAFVAARLGRGPAIASAVASVLVFDFFFVPPQVDIRCQRYRVCDYVCRDARHRPVDQRVDEPPASRSCRLATTGATHGAAVPHDAATQRAVRDRSS